MIVLSLAQVHAGQRYPLGRVRGRSYPGLDMPAIAKVEPLTTARTLRGPFDYLLPAALADVGVGSLLVVPFGRRRVLGVVVDLATESRSPRSGSPRRCDALEQGVPAELVRLAHWIADEYCSTPARALHAGAPAGGRGAPARAGPHGRWRRELTAAGVAALDDGARLGARQRAALEVLRAAGAPLATAGLPGGHDTARRLAERAAWSRSSGAPGRGAPPRGGRTPAPRGGADADRRPGGRAGAGGGGVGAGRTERLLLHGVTGSGKTEVYLRAVAAALERGASGDRARARDRADAADRRAASAPASATPSRCCTRGSRHGERYDEWRRLRARRGAHLRRPALGGVRAASRDLGLVVVDEEHDPSYKHEGDPRYDARRGRPSGAPRRPARCCWPAARRRGRRAGGACGASRCPSASTAGRCRRSRSLDMRDARARAAPATRARRSSESARAAQGDRAAQPPRLVELPLLPLAAARCGSARSATSRSCCTARDGRGRLPPLRPPRAGRRSAATPAARSSVARHGAGTERLEHELAEALGDPAFPVFRLDADTAAAARARSPTLLERFDGAPRGRARRHADGRQGPRLPRRHARRRARRRRDAALPRLPRRGAHVRARRPARRAARAAGPGGGRVLVQTLAPDAPSIVRAAAPRRRRLPRRRARAPARGAALPAVRDADPGRLRLGRAGRGAPRRAEAVARAPRLAAAAAVLGPAPLFRLRGRERSQLVVKARRARRRGRGRRRRRRRGGRRPRAPAAPVLSVDVDPQ